MNKKWAYCLAVLFLLVIRFGVLNTNYDQFLLKLGYANAAAFIVMLRESGLFEEYVASWAMLAFVPMTLAYWLTSSDDPPIPMHFLLLPIAYIPFSIIGTTLQTATFELRYLWVQPVIILSFGYLYVGFWTILIWLFEKLRLVQ